VRWSPGIAIFLTAALRHGNRPPFQFTLSSAPGCARLSRPEDIRHVTKEELGVKRDCPECGSRFYDLNREPAHCPKCDHEFVPEALLKPRKPRPDDAAAAAEAKSKKEASLAEADKEAKAAKSKRKPGLDEDEEDDDDEEGLGDLGIEIDDDDDDDDSLLDDDDDDDDSISIVKTGDDDDV
jgi:uncharacterized protein (TIGR02300 family)